MAGQVNYFLFLTIQNRPILKIFLFGTPKIQSKSIHKNFDA